MSVQGRLLGGVVVVDLVIIVDIVVVVVVVVDTRIRYGMKLEEYVDYY